MAFENKGSIELVDFMAEWSGLAEPKTRQRAEAVIEAFDDGNKTDKAELAQTAWVLAEEVWPIRFALGRFFSEEGAMIEWDRVEQAVRRSTAHLMERFKENTDCSSLDAMMAHEDFETAFREEERHEIEGVREHLREDYWRSHPKTLAPLVDEAKELAKDYRHRFEELNKITEGWPSLLAEEVLSKVADFEDRIFFRGEHVPMEILDQEIAYYREQKELPIEA